MTSHQSCLQFLYMMQTRFCRTQIPRTLECVILVFVLKTNIENFTNNNKLLFCQLSKLLKSYVSYKLALVNYQSVWTLIVNNHRLRR